MAKTNNAAGIILFTILALALLQYTGIFSIASFTGSNIQYTNAPIIAKVQTDLTNPQFSGTFNEQTTPIIVNNVNGTYYVTATNISSEGNFKVILSSGNDTFTQTIQVKKPYIEIASNLVSTMNKTASKNIEVILKTPQGNEIIDGTVKIDVVTPSSKAESLTMTYKDGKYNYVYNFNEVGKYSLTTKATKDGFVASQRLNSVEVLAKDYTSLYVFGGIGLIILLIIVVAVVVGRRK